MFWHYTDPFTDLVFWHYQPCQFSFFSMPYSKLKAADTDLCWCRYTTAINNHIHENLMILMSPVAEFVLPHFFHVASSRTENTLLSVAIITIKWKSFFRSHQLCHINNLVKLNTLKTEADITHKEQLSKTYI